MRYIFRDDYSEGCHPNILKALANTNMQQTTPYGTDIYSQEARDLIQAQLGTKAGIFFVSGGTLANLIIHSCSLKSHEAVIAPLSGHIQTNETGAIEAIGHKIITADVQNGKLTAENLQHVIDNHNHFPHVTRPRLVYISNATEIGSIYNKADMISLHRICRDNKLYFMMDGARMGAALASEANDLTLADIAKYVDIFWFGGTKTGALFGEAIIIPNKNLAQDFEFHLKQRGALLAKGRVLGQQFKELFTDNLYFELAKRANDLAKKMSDGIIDAGHEMAVQCQTNMLMAILPNDVIKHMQQWFDFYLWKTIDDKRSQVRLVTSWATDEREIDRFLEKLKKVS